MRTLSRALAALAAALVLPAMVAGAASAAVPGLSLVTTTSPASSLNRSQLAFCPAGTSLTGAGGAIGGGIGEVTLDDVTPEATVGVTAISGGFGRVVLKQMRPNGPGLSGFVASAAETKGGQSADWTIRSYAICASA